MGEYLSGISHTCSRFCILIGFTSLMHIFAELRTVLCPSMPGSLLKTYQAWIKFLCGVGSAIHLVPTLHPVNLQCYWRIMQTFAEEYAQHKSQWSDFQPSWTASQSPQSSIVLLILAHLHLKPRLLYPHIVYSLFLQRPWNVELQNLMIRARHVFHSKGVIINSFNRFLGIRSFSPEMSSLFQVISMSQHRTKRVLLKMVRSLNMEQRSQLYFKQFFLPFLHFSSAASFKTCNKSSNE